MTDGGNETKEPGQPSIRTAPIALEFLWLLGLILLIPAVAGWFETPITDVFYRLPTTIEQSSPLWAQRFALVNLAGLTVWAGWVFGRIWCRARCRQRSPRGSTLTFSRLMRTAQVGVTAVVAALAIGGTILLLVNAAGIPH